MTQQGFDALLKSKDDTQRSDLKSFLASLKAEKFTHQTHERITQRVYSRHEAIKTHIDNETARWNEADGELAELKTKDHVRSAIEKRVVPLELFEAYKRRYKALSEISAWKFLDCEMMKILAEHQRVALAEAKGLDIERDVLSRIDEQLKSTNQLHRDISIERLNAVEDRLMVVVKAILETSMKASADNTRLMVNALEAQSSAAAGVMGALLQHASRHPKDKEVKDLVADVADELEEQKKAIDAVKASAEKSSPESIKDEIRSVRKEALEDLGKRKKVRAKKAEKEKPAAAKIKDAVEEALPDYLRGDQEQQESFDDAQQKPEPKADEQPTDDADEDDDDVFDDEEDDI